MISHWRRLPRWVAAIICLVSLIACSEGVSIATTALVPNADPQATASAIIASANATAAAIKGTPIQTRAASPALAPTNTVPPTSVQRSAPTATSVQVGGGGPRGFMGYDTLGQLLFVQWTEANGNINGQMQIHSRAANNQVTTKNIPFTGITNGAAVNFTLSGDAYQGMRSLTGTISGGTLTLLSTGTSTPGQFAPIPLKAATVQEYNNAAQAFRQQVSDSLTQQREKIVGTWIDDKWSYTYTFKIDGTSIRVVTGSETGTYLIEQHSQSGDKACGYLAVKGSRSGTQKYDYCVEGDTLVLEDRNRIITTYKRE